MQNAKPGHLEQASVHRTACTPYSILSINKSIHKTICCVEQSSFIPEDKMYSVVVCKLGHSAGPASKFTNVMLKRPISPTMHCWRINS